MSCDLDITFGIEIEFVVAFQPAKYTNVSSEAELECFVRAHIIHSMQQVGLAVNLLHEPTNYEKWTVGKDGSIKPQPENPHLWKGWRFMGVELKTPIRRWEERRAAFMDLEDALQVIREQVSPSVNESCGLHVHVGNGTSGFPVSTVRQFAKMVTIFERQLATVHPHHRINNVHCRPPSYNFESRDIGRAVRILEDAPSLTQLVKRMSSNADGDKRGFGYNMRNLITQGALPTIEFRRHQATLEIPEIDAWTEVVCGLVDIAHGVMELWTNRPCTPDTLPDTLVELLRRLQMDKVADYYQWQLLHADPTSNEPRKFIGEAWVSDTPSLMSDSSDPSDTSTEPTDVEEGDDAMDWETKYALHDPFLEVKQDDEQDEDYRSQSSITLMYISLTSSGMSEIASHILQLHRSKTAVSTTRM
ncbi:MAG: hypothetical protein LQ350_006849 [Teloschistes chrysophthalmus]|nr:MAG: hypothetical protein LQ350_006849 [Niorma chrysophthalma]